MTSLAELRMIEEQRIVAERNTRIAEEQARRDAITRAEREAREAIDARIAAERAQALTIEHARVAAEREARMRVEATEATERARHTAALDEKRFENELLLRREAIQKTRPTWMVAVTIGAVIAGAALAVFAVDRMNSASQADSAAKRAEEEAVIAKKARAESAATVMSLTQDSADLDKQIAALTIRLEAKQSAADLELRKQELARLSRKKADNDERLRQAAIKKAHDDRIHGIRIDKEGENNAFTKKDFH